MSNWNFDKKEAVQRIYNPTNPGINPFYHMMSLSFDMMRLSFFKNNDDDSLLHIAIALGEKPVINQILNNFIIDTPLDQIKNYIGQNPFDIARAFNVSEDIVELLHKNNNRSQAKMVEAITCSDVTTAIAIMDKYDLYELSEMKIVHSTIEEFLKEYNCSNIQEYYQKRKQDPIEQSNMIKKKIVSYQMKIQEIMQNIETLYENLNKVSYNWEKEDIKEKINEKIATLKTLQTQFNDLKKDHEKNIEADPEIQKVLLDCDIKMFELNLKDLDQKIEIWQLNLNKESSYQRKIDLQNYLNYLSNRRLQLKDSLVQTQIQRTNFIVKSPLEKMLEQLKDRLEAAQTGLTNLKTGLSDLSSSLL